MSVLYYSTLYLVQCGPACKLCPNVPRVMHIPLFAYKCVYSVPSVQVKGLKRTPLELAITTPSPLPTTTPRGPMTPGVWYSGGGNGWYL